MRGSGWSVPRSTGSWPSAARSSSTRSRSFTPRWSNPTATLTSSKATRPYYAPRRDDERSGHDRSGQLARARTAAPCGLDPRGEHGEIRASDLVDVRGGSDGRPHVEVPALRLRPSRERKQRPPHLLEGTRVAPPLLHVQGGGRRH